MRTLEIINLIKDIQRKTSAPITLLVRNDVTNKDSDVLEVIANNKSCALRIADNEKDIPFEELICEMLSRINTIL